MDKITRYLILLLIIFIFFVLAPLIVLYVSGTSFNFGEKLTAGTGILDVQTDPNDATVYLNGEELDTTPMTERFIKQGTYDIEVKKDGYRDWKKRLFIESGQVTYAGTLGELIKLLPNDQPVQLEQADVRTVTQKENQLIYVRADNTAVIFDTNHNKVLKESLLPIQIARLTESENQNYLIAYSEDGSANLLTTDSLQLVELPAQIAKASKIDVTSNGIVFAATSEQLLAYDQVSKQVFTALSEDVLTFTINNNLLYVASTKANNSLVTYFWDGKTIVSQSILLSQALPSSTNYQLLLTNHKELFLLADKSLFRVNQELDLINDQVIFANMNRYRSQLTFRTQTEIFYYNFISNKSELLYRTTAATYEAIVSPELGYGFLATETGLQAVEIDNRNGQNYYNMLEGGPATIAMLSHDENNLWLIANNKLYSVLVNK